MESTLEKRSTGNGEPGVRQVCARAAVDALGMPFCVLLASMTGFGSLARESDLPLGVALSATVTIWGLPGQVAMAELYAAGSGLLAITLAVSLANARFLPMAVSFMPLLRRDLRHGGSLYAIVQLLSVNSWVGGLRAFPRLPERLRRHYFVAFAAVCMTAGLLGTALGFLLVDTLPHAVALGLIFLNPLFFAIVFAGAEDRMVIRALLIGAALGPLFHLLSPDWGVLVTGLAGGTLAWMLQRRASRGKAGGSTTGAQQ